jgi:WD40 repeat protein
MRIAMNRPCSCPETSRLKRLIDGNTPDDEQAELVGHLDHCEPCQHSLEELATGGTNCASMVRHVDRDVPPSESAYWHVVRDLAAAPDVTRIERPSARRVPDDDDDEELSLDFLQAAEAPDALGRLGHFDVTEVIGRGGMGVVLKGFDSHLQRFVALKVLSPRLANNDIARKRFCRESRIAASITHENVVAVHQVEREEGSNLPFLVMQLVDGESLQDRLDREGPLPIRDIIDIAAQAASGLAAAHAKGLIHRDIKPANILLEDGKRVRLTDFGLARLTEDAKLTQTGFVAGTPLYMSPEQARGEELDARADIFSLGGVLYAMCTGKAPFEGSTPYIILKRVTEEPPVPIQQVNPEMPDCLVKFIDKLLAKRPSERFQTAAEVHDLLERQRALLRLGTTVDSPCAEKAPPCNRRAKLALLALTFSLLLGTLILGSLMPGWLGGLFHMPATTPPATKERMSFPGNSGPVWSVALSPDGDSAAMGIDDGAVKIWDTHTGEIRATLNGRGGPVWAIAYSPDGKFLAAGSTDKKLHVWNLAKDEESNAWSHLAPVRSIAFSKDGTKLAVGCRDGTVSIWDFPTGSKPIITEAHNGEIVSIAFSPDGKTVASGSGDSRIKLWDAANGKERLTLRGHVSGVLAVAFSPDGKTLASGGWDKKIHLWDTASGNELTPLPGHSQDIWSIAFSPNGKYLATGSEDRTARVWDVTTGKEVAVFDRHMATVYTVAFSKDGKTLATGGRDGSIKLWDVPE